MTFVFATLALAFSPSLQAPDLTKTISFEHMAAPAKRVVAELGAKNGLKVDVSPQVAPDVVFVSVRDVTIKELMDRMALAVNGEWTTETDGTIRLIRPAANANREVAAERQERLLALQKELKKHVEALKKQANQKPDSRETPGGPVPEAMFMGDDNAKHILTLLQRINLNDLVFVDENSRVVFSSAPTRMQKLLPGNLDPIVADLVADHNKKAAASKNKPSEEEIPDDETTRQWMEWAKNFGFMKDPKPIEGQPAKLLLVAQGQPFMGGLELELRLYDSRGKVVVSSDLNLGMGEFMEDAMALANPKAKPAPSSEDKPIEFTAATKELTSIFGNLMQGQSRAKLSGDLEAKLLRPDLYDPLSFAPSESLAAVAKAKKLDVVAHMPDSMNSIMEMFGPQENTVNTFLRSIESNDELKVEKPEGWLVVSPKQPVKARRDRADRMALAKLVGAAKAKGLASLDDIAAYAQTSPSPYESSSAMPYLMLFAPNAIQQGMMGMVDWNAIRLYGTLNIAQRQTLSEKGRIPIGNLSPAQRNLLSAMAFGSQHNLQVQDPNAKPKEDQGFMEMAMSFMNRSQNDDFRNEPTEVMPMGLPPAGYLTGDIAREPIAKSASQDPMLMFGALGADEIAMLKYFKEDPNMAMMAGMMPTLDQVRLGERTNITLKAFVAPQVALERSLQDHRIDPNGPVMSANSLPADFQARIDKRLAAFKKNPMPGFGGLGGGVKPPNPAP